MGGCEGIVFFLLCGGASPIHTRATTQRERERGPRFRDRERGQNQNRERKKKTRARQLANPGLLAHIENPVFMLYSEWTPRNPKRSTATFEWKRTKKTHRGRLPTADLQQKTGHPKPRPPNSNTHRPTRPTPRLPNYRKFTRTPPKSNKFKYGIEQNSIIPEYEHRNSKTQSHLNANTEIRKLNHIQIRSTEIRKFNHIQI